MLRLCSRISARPGVLLLRDVADLLEQRQVDVRLDVALRARVAVPVPRAAEVAALLDDADVVDAGLAQPGAGEQPAEAAADDDHVDLVGQRLAVDRLDVGVLDEVGEVAGDLDVLVVAVRRAAACRARLGTSRAARPGRTRAVPVRRRSSSVHSPRVLATGVSSRPSWSAPLVAVVPRPIGFARSRTRSAHADDQDGVDGDPEDRDRSGRRGLRRRPARIGSTATSSATSTTACCPAGCWRSSRHGQLAHVSTYGQRDVEAGLPVETDTIWRIYSMTKPITAVAALVAYEQGLFELNDPVRWYIPSFGDTKVWRSGSFTAPVLEPITEELRVWQLFAHTSGLTYGFMQNHPVDALYRQAGFEWGTPTDATDLAGICDHLAAPAARVPARHRVAVQHGPRRARPGHRGRRRRAVRRVPADPRARPAGHDRHRLARRRGPRRSPRRAVRPDARHQAGVPLRRDGVARDDAAGRPARRRRAVRHGRRLRPLRRDAAQPRRARRRAHPRPEDGRADGQQPPARRRRPHAPSVARCSPRPRSTASASASASA